LYIENQYNRINLQTPETFATMIGHHDRFNRQLRDGSYTKIKYQSIECNVKQITQLIN